MSVRRTHSSRSSRSRRWQERTSACFDDHHNDDDDEDDVVNDDDAQDCGKSEPAHALLLHILIMMIMKMDVQGM